MQHIVIEGFTVSGPSVRTSNEAERGLSGKIAGLWGQFYASRPDQSNPIYGVYSDYESDANGEFTVTAGTKVSSGSGQGISIKSGTYLAFRADGAMPAAIIGAWKAVWEHFSSNQPYVRAYETDYEEYTGLESAVIYIGIKK
jgi:predicted transcriptional regulator YdeE